MQPEQFVNLVLEKSKGYLEEDDEKLSLPRPILFTLTNKGDINSFEIPDGSSQSLAKYRTLTLVRRFIKNNSVVAYAITKKSLTRMTASKISINANTRDQEDMIPLNDYYGGRRIIPQKEKEEKANQTLKEELKDAPQILNAIRIFYASIEEKKEIVIPYTRDYNKIVFEGFEEIRIDRISKGLMFGLLN